MTDRDRLGAPQRPSASLIIAFILAIALFVLFVYAVLLGRDWEDADASEAATAGYGGVVAELVKE